MTNFKSTLISGSSWKLLSYITAFLLNVIISHQFGSAESGKFYLLLNNLVFISVFLSLGIDSGINYFNPRKEISANILFSISIIWSAALSVLFCLVYYSGILNSFLPAFNNSGIYFTAFIFSTLVINSLSSLCYSMNDNITPNLAIACINIILIIFNPLFIKSITIADYYKIYLGLNSVALFGFLLFLGKRKIFFAAIHISKEKLKVFFRYSFTSYLASLLFILLLRFDYWLVYHFCNPGEIGNYIQTSKFLQLIVFVPNLASFVLFPLTVSSIYNNKNIEAKLLQLSNIYFYLGLLICIVIASIGFRVFPMLYGESFNMMYALFLIQVPGIICFSASYAIAPFFNGKNKIGINIKSIVISILAMLILDLILIPRFSVYGAAMGSSIGYILYYLLLLYYFRKHVTFNYKSIIGVRNLNVLIRDFIHSKASHEN